MGRAKRFAAVDFDSRRLRIALVELTAKGSRIDNLADVALPDGLDRDDPQAFGAFLGEVLKDLGFRGAGMVMNVPRSQAVLKPLSLPPGTPGEDLAGMVYYQVGKELPFPTEDAVIDFTIERHYGAESSKPSDLHGSVDVLVAAVRMAVVDRYRRVASAAGVKLLRLGLRPYANARCVQACLPSAAQQTVALVHITADETEIDVLSRRSLAFSRSAVHEVRTEESHRARAVGFIVAEITRSLQSYQAVEGGRRIDAVLIAGGTGIESQAGEQFARRFNVPSEILRPGKALAGRDERQIASKFISALGLAVAHPASDGPPFDFLNPKRPVARRDTRKTRAAAVAVAAAAVLLGAVLAGWVYLHGKQGRLLALQVKASQLNKEIAAARKVARRVDAIENWLREGRNWLDHWANLSALFPSAKEVYITDLKTGKDSAISFTVQARSSETITALGKKLLAAGYQFKPGQIKTGNDRLGYVYATAVRVFPSEEVKTDLAATRPAGRPEDDSSAEEFYRRSSSRRDGGLDPQRRQGDYRRRRR